MGQGDVVADLLDFGANVIFTICDVLRDLLPFLQFKTPMGECSGCFSRFVNCANGTKPRKKHHIWCLVLHIELGIVSKFRF